MPSMQLSDELIQRLNDVGFKLSLAGNSDWHFNDLMSFKAKYGNCNVSQHGEDPSLGSWCNGMRSSYKRIQNNQMPNMILSDEHVQRLDDAGFKWSLKSTFEERFNDIMSF
jgi:hypothetical protein